MIEVAGVLIIQNGKYVLQHRDDIPTIADPGMVGPWGGTIEEGESPKQAALRELEEETGVIVDESSLKHLITYETSGKGPKSSGKPVIAHLFSVKLDPEAKINCYEGKAIFYAESADDVPKLKRSEFFLKAVEVYESSR